jgi:hypothetical protein
MSHLLLLGTLFCVLCLGQALRAISSSAALAARKPAMAVSTYSKAKSSTTGMPASSSRCRGQRPIFAVRTPSSALIVASSTSSSPSPPQ